MELYWHIPNTGLYNDGGGLNLDDVWAEPHVATEEDLFQDILFRIALWAIGVDRTLDEVTGFTLDHDGGELEIKAEGSNHWGWLSEVAKLVFFDQTSHVPTNATLGYIENEGWDSVNFDCLARDIEDNYSQEYEGDYTDFAHQHMSDVGEEIPDHMEKYFDYESYGETLVDGYNRVEFANEEYLFHL